MAGICEVFASLFHQLVHILGNFIIGHFGIACVVLMFVCPIILLMLSIGTPAESVKVPNECLLA